MGQIQDPALQSLSVAWSQTFLDALDRIGREAWPLFKERRGLLGQSRTVIPYTLEGSIAVAGQVFWAVTHVSRPSGFDASGDLLRGERAYWLISLRPGGPPMMTIEGSKVINFPLDPSTDWQALLNQAVQAGPKVEEFYGNKGPLSHR